MATKLILFALATIAIASAAENSQSGPDFSEYFNQFQEQIKPILGNFPNFPSGFGPGSGSGSGSFPFLPSFGGSRNNGPVKRQVSPNTIGEWFSQLGQGNNPFGGNFEFKPPAGFGQFGQFGQLPFGGSSGSGSGETSNHES